MTALHLQDATQRQIDILKDQQTQFEKKINNIVNDISRTDQQVAAASNVDQKVVILENAILSER